MELKIFIDKTHNEEILVYAHENNHLINEIAKLVNEDSTSIIGYSENSAEKLSLVDVACFITENNKTYAICNRRLQVKMRLYQLESILGDDFIKINQSCIANIRQIEKVEATFSGSLSVLFKNGYRDYISRRNLKSVKERLGI